MKALSERVRKLETTKGSDLAVKSPFDSRPSGASRRVSGLPVLTAGDTVDGAVAPQDPADAAGISALSS